MKLRHTTYHSQDYILVTAEVENEQIKMYCDQRHEVKDTSEEVRVHSHLPTLRSPVQGNLVMFKNRINGNVVSTAGFQKELLLIYIKSVKSKMVLAIVCMYMAEHLFLVKVLTILGVLCLASLKPKVLDVILPVSFDVGFFLASVLFPPCSVSVKDTRCYCIS